MSAVHYKVKSFINEKKENLSLAICEGQLTIWIGVYAELKSFSMH